jgi:hypothetical protein
VQREIFIKIKLSNFARTSECSGQAEKNCLLAGSYGCTPDSILAVQYKNYKSNFYQKLRLNQKAHLNDG